MNEYEESRAQLELLAIWYRGREGQRNEATTRLQLIDRLLFEVLGWHRDDVILEEPHDGQYSDYTLVVPRKILIVEAKKEGEYFEIPTGKRTTQYSLSTLTRENKNLRLAVEQVSEYCQKRGVPYAVVANGHQLVCFLASRSDGISPSEGRAIIFSSLDHMLEESQLLWKMLSKSGLESRHIQRLLVGEDTAKLPPKIASNIPDYPGRKRRNVFQADLQILSELVIEDIVRSRDLEPLFLQECYCPSGALSQYALVSKAVLEARYAELFTPEPKSPTVSPLVEREDIAGEFSVQSFSRRPILLIGDVGVGKTMFVRHLMNIDAEDIFSNAISLYIDFGTRAALSADISDIIADEIASQLQIDHSTNILERNFVRAVYHQDLMRFGEGIHGDLKSSHPDQFKQKEVEYLEEKLTHRVNHLRYSLHHLAHGRKKQIIVFLDNADQRNDEFQHRAFLIAQELADHWPVTVFLSLRPETFQKSTKQGALTGYHPKAFTVSPPRIDRVIHKRLEFALKLTSGKIQIKSLPVGSMVYLPSLETVIKAFLFSLERNEDILEFIENVTGGNVRMALDIVKQFFGSGHVDTKKIVEIYNTQGSYVIPLHELERAIFYADNEHYDPDVSPIVNLHDISFPDPKDHFTLPILLTILSKAATSASAEEGFVETSRLYNQMQSLEFTPDHIDLALIRAIRSKLVETSGRLTPSAGGPLPQSVRTTTSGSYHVARLCRRFTYLDAITVDTPILDASFHGQVNDVRDVSQRLQRAEIMVSYLDSMWAKGHLDKQSFNWPGVRDDLRADIMAIRGRIEAKQGIKTSTRS